jgi:coenzyme F420-reducing hydrogenase delta subunit
MSSEEKKIRVKKLRVVADELVIEPSRIIIKRPSNKEKRKEEEFLGLAEEFEEE